MLGAALVLLTEKAGEESRGEAHPKAGQSKSEEAIRLNHGEAYPKVGQSKIASSLCVRPMERASEGPVQERPSDS